MVGEEREAGEYGQRVEGRSLRVEV